MAKVKLTYSAETDVGLVRDTNQDWYGVAGPQSAPVRGEDSYIFVVADGMGGHAFGDRASKSAVKTLLSRFGDKPPAPNTREWMEEGVLLVNRRVYEEGADDPPKERRGTTLTALVIRGDTVTIGHVGDSRAYLIRRGKMRQVTEDHTVPGRMLKEGLITKEEAEESSRKSELLQAVGNKESVSVEIQAGRIERGDILILTSDGLTNQVPDETIQNIVETYPPKEAVDKLIALAKKNGGHDNITAIVVKVGDVTVPLLKGKTLRRVALAVGIIIALTVTIWAVWQFEPFGLFSSREEVKPEEVGELEGFPWEEYVEVKDGEVEVEGMPEEYMDELVAAIKVLYERAKSLESQLADLHQGVRGHPGLLEELGVVEGDLAGYRNQINGGLSNPKLLSLKGVIKGIEDGLEGIKFKIYYLRREIEKTKEIDTDKFIEKLAPEEEEEMRTEEGEKDKETTPSEEATEPAKDDDIIIPPNIGGLSGDEGDIE